MIMPAVSMEETMTILRTSRGALIMGLALGVVFSVLNVVSAYVAPLADDSLAALGAFYGPMFLAWGLAGFAAARRRGRPLVGLKTGALVAFGTFVVLTIVVIVRVNLSLPLMTQRPDWQNLMARFNASGFESLRTYVNYEYLKGAPFKILVASTIGAVFGLLGGCTTLATPMQPHRHRQGD
jgi:hypothetical protein